jgi:hypothetical protein
VLATSPLSMHQAELIRQWSDRVVVFTAGLGQITPEAERRLRSRGIVLEPEPVTRILGEGTSLASARLADGPLGTGRRDLHLRHPAAARRLPRAAGPLAHGDAVRIVPRGRPRGQDQRRSHLGWGATSPTRRRTCRCRSGPAPSPAPR